MTAKIHIERMMHRTSVSVAGESVASYALLKLIPTGGEESNQPIGLNLAIVLDVSGSMYEEDGTGKSRLNRIQSAAMSALNMLQPQDSLALVAFGHDAQIILPSTKLIDRKKIEDVIERVDRHDVDPGGTSMDQGLRLAMEEVEKSNEPGKLTQIVVLTDGETSGEQMCRQLAGLLKDMAQLAQGKWYYIDVSQADDAERAFVQEFGHLSQAGFTNVELQIWPIKDVKVKRTRQVVPEIKELPVTEPEERHLVVSLGTLEKDKPTRYVLDLSLPKRPDGSYVILQLEVSYSLGGGRRESTGKVPLQIQYAAAGQGYVNAEVARHIDEVQIFELNKNLQEAIASNDSSEAQRVAETISRKGELLGPRAAKKTMLARQVLQELHGAGRVSKKTQLAVDDVARMAEEMPVSS